MLNTQIIADLFPALHQTIGDNRLVYLDSAATTQKPQCVIDTLVNYYTRYNANIHRGAYSIAEKATLEFENARKKVAKFINANNDEIIFTFWNYPYHIKEDSVIIFSDETIIPFVITGFQFNDSLDIDVKITMIDSLGDSSSPPTFNQTAVNGMYDFQKQLYIELSELELQGADTLIIQYTATDWAGNISIHKIKYNLFTEDDISGLVDRIFNYPNPFGSVDGGTQIRYILTNDAQNGKYVIFDAKGELVYHYSLSENDLLKGTHTITWSGKYLNDKYVLATGVYFGFLDIDDMIAKHKLVIMN